MKTNAHPTPRKFAVAAAFVLMAITPAFATMPVRAGQNLADQNSTGLAPYETPGASLTDTEDKLALAPVNPEAGSVASRKKVNGTSERPAELQEKLRAYLQSKDELHEEFQQIKYDAVSDQIKTDRNRQRL